MLNRHLTLLPFLAALALAIPRMHAQTQPAFEVATIKPVVPGHGLLGFYAYPGGKVVIGGATIKTLLHYALDIQEFQIAGGPDWITKTRFDIVALPPDYADSGNEKHPPVSATPTEIQRKMLLTLITERFGLKYHRSEKPGNVYFLLKTSESPLLKEAKDSTLDPRGGIMITMQGTPNGDAFGSNLSMPRFARAIAENLDRPVIDQTGLTGTYDFQVKAAEPNQGDTMDGISAALRPLGLQIKAGKAPMDTITIDNVTPATPN